MKVLTMSILLVFSVTSGRGEAVTVRSPDGRLRATLDAGPTLSLRIDDAGTPLVGVSSLILAVRGQSPFGPSATIVRVERTSRDTVIRPPVREKFAVLNNRYQEAAVTFAGGFGLILRAYDDGIAYRFVTGLKGTIVIESESFALALPESTVATYQLNPEFWSAYEYPYHTTTVAGIPTDGICNLPLVFALRDGRKVLMTEAAIENYPGLWLKRRGGDTLVATLPGYPLALLETKENYTRGKVMKFADEIARTKGTRRYPWRLFAVARRDADLLTNALVYLLAEPSRVADVSWVRPGTVTLDWWARRNIFGVDFVSGVNTATAKYMIDFAAHYGIRYLLLDAEWTPMDDLLTVRPELNLEEVIAYAHGKGVGVFLWAVWSTLERQWDEAFANFSRWKIDGIKVDFMNRDDQAMVDWYYKVAEECARRKLIVMFHGAYKPDGFSRTYPNALTREGLVEFEQNGGNLSDSPEYHTILPFVRMVAGPADYLPGTVYNAQPHEFRMLAERPMGQGTRAHTMALCVLIESPIRMLPDSPPDYYREDESTKFMTSIPVEWDDLRVLQAKMGDYVAVARRRGDEWFVAAVTDGEARDLELDCSFLTAGVSYVLTAFSDGVNAERRAVDYSARASAIGSTDRLKVHLAPGGGFVGRIQIKN